MGRDGGRRTLHPAHVACVDVSRGGCLFLGLSGLLLMLVPFSLLVLAIPIPTIIFNKIAFPLQLFASRCAVWAMRLFDIPVLREGNVIELMPLGSARTKKLEVVEACSGIRSLMTLLTLAVVFAYFTHPKNNNTKDEGKPAGWFLTRYSFWRATILVLAAIPIAIVTNAMRVSGTGILARYYGTEIADGFFHSFSGWVVYIAAFLLLFGLGWLLDRVAWGTGGKANGTGVDISAASQESVGIENREETLKAGGASPVEVRPVSATEGPLR